MNRWNDEHYLEWLYEFIADRTVQEPEESYILLAEQMYLLPFRYSIGRDADRAEDGLQLRDRYAARFNIPDEYIPITPCSFLEMLIALSERALFISDELLPMRTIEDWIAHLFQNTSLVEYTDAEYFSDDRARSKVNAILNTIMDRRYNTDGERGLFPIKDTELDQRSVELWYQMNEYISSQIEWAHML